MHCRGLMHCLNWANHTIKRALRRRRLLLEFSFEYSSSLPNLQLYCCHACHPQSSAMGHNAEEDAQLVCLEPFVAQLVDLPPELMHELLPLTQPRYYPTVRFAARFAGSSVTSVCRCRSVHSTRTARLLGKWPHGVPQLVQGA